VREALGELDPVLYGDLGGGHREQRFPGVLPGIRPIPNQTLVFLINDSSQTGGYVARGA
jgi:hypothetical protein